MSSSDNSGARSDRYRSGLALFAASVAAVHPSPFSLVEALKCLLDAAEQRNAEDSPSGIARLTSPGLTG